MKLRYSPIHGNIREERAEQSSTAVRRNGGARLAGTKLMEDWNTINYSARIRRDYANDILPRVCCFPHEKDEGYEEGVEESEDDIRGSAALCDIAVLQSLSRRIHFGKFVAEAKFQAERSRYEGLIRRRDVRGIERTITDEGVERKVLERLALKAMVYGRDPASEMGKGRIDVEGVVGMYRVSLPSSVPCFVCAVFAVISFLD